MVLPIGAHLIYNNPLYQLNFSHVAVNGREWVSLALVQPWERLGSLTPVIDCDGRRQGHPDSELGTAEASLSFQARRSCCRFLSRGDVGKTGPKGGFSGNDR